MDEKNDYGDGIVSDGHMYFFEGPIFLKQPVKSGGSRNWVIVLKL